MMRLGIALALTLAASLPAPRTHAWGTWARLSYYEPTGSPMASGEWPYEGAAACGSGIGFGSTVYIPRVDVTLVCHDTGLLEPFQVDVFSWGGRPGWMQRDYEVVEVWQ